MWRRHWRIVAVVGVQLLILAAVPGKKVLALMHGETITLRTRPVDPYDLLSGYYVTLAYEVEETAPEKAHRHEEGDTVYITVVRDEPAWRGVEITDEPVPPTLDRRSLKATWDGSRLHLEGIGRFYIPEAQRQRATEAMNEVKGRALVDLRVAEDGTPALVRLRAGDKSWGK